MCDCPHNTISVPTVGNYSLRDYGTFAGVTALCAPYGYYVGESLHVPHASISHRGEILWGTDACGLHREPGKHAHAIDVVRAHAGSHGGLHAGISAVIRS